MRKNLKKLSFISIIAFLVLFLFFRYIFTSVLTEIIEKKVASNDKDINLEITKGTSILQNGWYNSDEVEVTITMNTQEEQKKTYKIEYGIRRKEEAEEKINLIPMTEKEKKIIIKEEGITEVSVYKENNLGKRTKINSLDVRIDRTPPTVEKVTCLAEGENDIRMIAKNAKDNEGGSGIEEYIFFKDNKVAPEDVMRTEKNEIVFKTKTSEFLGEVIVYDKAGNQSTVKTTDTASTAGKFLYEIYPRSTYVWTQERICDQRLTPNNVIHFCWKSDIGNNWWYINNISIDQCVVFRFNSCTEILNFNNTRIPKMIYMTNTQYESLVSTNMFPLKINGSAECSTDPYFTAELSYFECKTINNQNWFIYNIANIIKHTRYLSNNSGVNYRFCFYLDKDLGPNLLLTNRM